MSKKTSFANDCKEFQSAAQLTSGSHMLSNGDLVFHLIKAASFHLFLKLL